MMQNKKVLSESNSSKLQILRRTKPLKSLINLETKVKHS